ncbi:sugar-binding transcriptional regulator [Ureibacillus aquaedulcis]|uniref:Sugar-binding domain-containing protein n=1 Tax=Ureibacillus aquaedulcis TaxID=3058421 RepID=A0ABT8GNW7_9BACL|nr:sugar-binding domain-containing protein [Ureibacillus sp. BA0131]MDN4493115.1 sugar-binding domain-containing protein [Ureibacillus sp. BA0131]
MKNNSQQAVQLLVPELSPIIQLRYRILQTIAVAGPIGRRMILETLHISERTVRNEITLLNNQGLIETTQKGMICTNKGYEILEELKSMFQEVSGLRTKEKKLAEILGIKKVIIVPGDINVDANTQMLIGKEASEYLTTIADKDFTVAITGGSTVAALKNFMSPSKSLSTLTFVAARGSLGNEMSLQANTLVSKFASKCGADFRTLYLPEKLSETAFMTMIQEPVVKEVLDFYDHIDIVIHGIGTSKEMAHRRDSSEAIIKMLDEKKAVGEAFGYYFDEAGEIIYRINTIGIQLQQVKKSPHIIAVAGGSLKAKAIQAYFKKEPAHQTILITDEGAANAILEK